MPFAPPPRPSWWSRQPAAIKVLLVSGVAVLTCCGGLLGIGVAAEPDTAPEKAVAQEVPTVTASTTTAPAPEVSTASPEPSPSPTTAAPTQPASKPSPRKTTKPAVHYKNCDAVRAAGKAPLLRGQPGYRTGLDRDLDGEACEPGGGNGDSGGGSTGGGSTGGGGSSGGGGNDPRFGTCKEANANGYGPYRQGKDPEYYWYIDRDNDGTVCE